VPLAQLRWLSHKVMSENNLSKTFSQLIGLKYTKTRLSTKIAQNGILPKYNPFKIDLFYESTCFFYE